MKDILLFNIRVLKHRASIKSIFASIPIIAFLLTFAFYNSKTNVMQTGNQIFGFFFIDVNKRAILNSFLVVLPLFMAMIYGDYHYYEKPAIDTIMIRCEKRHMQYIINAFLSFMLGFLSVSLFLFCMFLFNFIITYHPDHSLSYSTIGIDELQLKLITFAKLFQTNPYIYIAFQAFLLSIYGAFLSLSTYVVSLFCKAKIITYVSMMGVSLVSMVALSVFASSLSTWNLQVVFSPQLEYVIYHEIAIIMWCFTFLFVNMFFLALKIRKLGDV